MDGGVAPWIVVPLAGGLIGYVTNRLAVAMIFRPIRPRRVLGLRVQGLIGRRQEELAASIGRVVGQHLVQHQDLVDALRGIDLERSLGELLERALAQKLAELRRLPLVGGLLNERRVGELKRQIVGAILADEEALVAAFERALEEGLDVPALVSRKVAAFPVERVEALVLEVAARELRAIELLGGVLGLLIGLAQVLLLRLV